MRPSILAVLLAAAAPLAGPPAPARAQSDTAIGLAGFVLGAPGAAVRAGGRCTPVPKQTEYDRCAANDSTTVWLSRDTIVGVMLAPEVPGRYRAVNREATDWWGRGLRERVEGHFGPADTVTPFSAGQGSSAPMVPEGREWDLLTDGSGVMANWLPRSGRKWDARVVLGRVWILRGQLAPGATRILVREARLVRGRVQFDGDVGAGVLSRAEVSLACSGHLFSDATRDSSGTLVRSARPGPTASCPRGP